MTRLALAATLVLCVFAAPRAEACRGPFPSVEKAVKAAEVIFVGTVLEVSQAENEFLVTFTIDEVIKGATPDKVIVVHGPAHTCGFGFGVEKGQRFLIFTRGASFGTDATSGNKLGPDEKLLARVRTLAAPPKK